MADQPDTEIKIGIKADLSGGVQTEKQFERLKLKALELGRETRKCGNDSEGAIGRIKGAIGSLNQVLSGFGAVAIISRIISLYQSWQSRIEATKDKAAALREEMQKTAAAEAVKKIADAYRKLQQEMDAAAEKSRKINELIDTETQLRRSAEDEDAKARMAAEIASIDRNAPDAQQQEAAIRARYGRDEALTSASRRREDVLLQRQKLGDEAALARKRADLIEGTLADDEAAIVRARTRYSTNMVLSTNRNAKDVTFFNRFYDWSGTTEAGDAVREHQKEEAESAKAEVERLEKDKAVKEKQVAELRAQAVQAEKKIELLGDYGLKAAASAEHAAGITGDHAVAIANADLRAAGERALTDRATIAGAGAKRADIQGRIDAANARLSAAGEAVNKEDYDVYLAQQRLEQSDAEHRGKGWRRYATGDRQQLTGDVAREQDEANEARANLERVKSEVAEILKQLNDEMRQFQSELKAAQSRSKVHSDCGVAE